MVVIMVVLVVVAVILKQPALLPHYTVGEGLATRATLRPAMVSLISSPQCGQAIPCRQVVVMVGVLVVAAGAVVTQQGRYARDVRDGRQGNSGDNAVLLVVPVMVVR